jgi:uncharacterized membrane protein
MVYPDLGSGWSGLGRTHEQPLPVGLSNFHGICFFLRRLKKMHYFPVALPFMILFAVLLVVLIAVIEVGVLRYAYHKIGIGPRHMFLLLLLSFLGSYVNIPVWQLPHHPLALPGVVSFHGILHVVPIVRNWPGTVIAINLGGAIIPAFLSIYLLIKNRLLQKSLAGIGIVAVFVHLMATPVKGVGIAVPTYLPPLIAAAVGIFLSRQYAPPLAYIAGSLGTLVGADLLNLGKIQGLGAPVASIGGAGTFDGIFLTGILAVLLAGLFSKDKGASRNLER